MRQRPTTSRGVGVTAATSSDECFPQTVHTAINASLEITSSQTCLFSLVILSISLSRGTHKRRVSVPWCDIISEFQLHEWCSTGLKNQSTHVIQWTNSTKLFALDVTSGSRTKVDTPECDWEMRKIQGQPNTKEITQKKNPSRRTRKNGAGDAVLGSQENTRRVQNSQLADVPAAQPVPTVRARRRRTQEQSRH